jgi:hypothetical protein
MPVEEIVEVVAEVVAGGLDLRDPPRRKNRVLRVLYWSAIVLLVGLVGFMLIATFA